MRILTNLLDKASDTLEEIEWYAKEALILRNEHKELSDVYIKIAESHVSIYNMLHERMVSIIAEKRKTETPPAGMLELWKYEHEKLIKEFAEAKYLIDEYKKTY